uniref:E3 ubiquitin-protein ligase RNF170-like n=1 Tax=Styela clava TaxID=7725 RepID=UPI001939D670|nr:E3 ubiquitin-protein ligase RNF170-like [Styela clava]
MTDERSPSGNYIEGVGDEVVIFLSTLLMFILPISTYLVRKYRSDSDHEIHPENQERVNTTRSHLNINENEQEDDALDGDVDDRRRFYSDQRCPICLQEARLPVETNCGHLFCAHCIITYWRFGNWLGAVNCPVCRQQVSLLLRNFQAGENHSEATRDALTNINDYNRRFSGQPRPILDYIRDIPALMRHLWSEFFSMGGLVFMFRVRIVLCAIAILLYLISPLDFLPEAVFGIIGLLDDVFVLMLVLIYMTVIYRNVVAAR